MYNSSFKLELGTPVEAVFSDFDYVAAWVCLYWPSACRHFARWPPVVVKVQHEGIEQVVMTDLQIMQQVAGLTDRYMSGLPYDVSAIVDEFQRQLMRELDLLTRGAQPRPIHQEFPGRNDCAVPAAHARIVHESMCSPWNAWKVLRSQTKRR